ncbi:MULTISPECIES: GH92 family glycosyl hydrolase [unclassified Knoellia]|uniref:GH92 family glycosyl hydrolase n=1 Tax=Knoellia altitudinis TaxID=3404795 RepID=UPI00361AFEAC
MRTVTRSLSIIVLAATAFGPVLPSAGASAAPAAPAAPAAAASEPRAAVVNAAAPAFETSFEEGDPQPNWVDTPDLDAQGRPRAAGVTGASILGRGPSTVTGPDLLAAPTDQLGWEGPFQNGVGSVPGTIASTTTAAGEPAVRWSMQSQGETWIQVPMPGLALGTTYRAQVTLQGAGELFLNVYSGSSDVGGEAVTLTDTPQTLTVDLTTPGSRGGTPQFQIRTRARGAINAVVSAPSVQKLVPGAVDFPGNVTDQVVKVTASRENAPNETAAKLADGDVGTKWLAGGRSNWVTYELAAPAAVVAYALGSANDAPGRDPRDWTLQGSANGTSWTPLDTRANQGFPNRFQTRQYSFTNTTAYRFYRLNITANAGDDGTQLAEWMLSTKAIPPTDMTTTVGSGPGDAYNSRPNVGFTGTAALHYMGAHTAEGRGYSYNKVLDVDLPVTATTELAYKIFPELTGGDLSYPSTHAAVDLAFTDGTHLSNLQARDQHGRELSPQGQGAAKVLYANQWNSVVSSIGAVAAGKTVDRIVVAYDKPQGPADFGGWIDDISVGAAQEATTSPRPSDHVITTRGTNSSDRFSRGNTIPATTVPHGFNFWTPVTNAGTTRWLYDYARGNNAKNRPQLQALALSHQPSPWMGDRQTFQVMPSAKAGVPAAGRAARSLTFSHDNEVAKPHYYGVTFDNGLKAEITPTDHAAMMRFTYPGDQTSLVLDNINDAGGLTLNPADRSISGYTDVGSGDNSLGMTRMFVHATFDAAVTDSGKLDGGGGGDVTGFLRFDAGPDRTVTMRIATSLISLEQARKNLALEIAPADSFEDVRERAQAMWDEKLGVIDVEGATPDQRTTLYSNLYRLSVYPNSGHENVGTAAAPVLKHAVQSSVSTDPSPGATTPTTTGARVTDGKVYVNNGFWDTYRTTWPAYSMLYPTQAGEMVNGFLQQYKDSGWVSRWSAPGYANSMTGTSSDVAFADAYLKGVPGIDVQTMYDAALKNAEVAPPNENVGRKGADRGLFLGYTPTSVHESASWSLEGYVNDYGIANLSKKLYDSTDASDPRHAEYKQNYDYFLSRAQDYVRLFNPKIGFFQGRTETGAWRQSSADFDPKVWGFEFTESNGWNFAFHAPQDGKGLANLLGGRSALGDKLDEFFATPETAELPGSYGRPIHEMLEARDVRQGQWGLSNQLSHHIPYMYNYAGEPSKGAAAIREALARSFTGSEIGQGYPGDEDNGELSAWQVFSSLGFYPLQMGSPTYAIGSPQFTKATLHLESGKSLVISAPRNSASNVYVQGVRVNGVAQSRTWLSHDQIVAGGNIEFDMGATPSAWGTGPDDAPPSITEGTRVPNPLTDVTGPGKGTSRSSETGKDVASLFDDTSGTRVTFAGTSPKVSYGLGGATARVTSYTLTSPATEDEPSSWVLEGSQNGTTWTPLDRRTNEKFQWRLQTRPFAVTTPGIYRHYRLSVTGSRGTASTSLAEVQLLARAPQVAELQSAVDQARKGGGLNPSTARDLSQLLTQAAQAEAANNTAAVMATLEKVRAMLVESPSNRIEPAARDAILLVLSQWMSPATGLPQLREQVAALERSGDIQKSTATELLGILTKAQQAEAGSHAVELRTQLTALRSAVAGARTNKVSEKAKGVLLPLIDALLATPPSVTRTKDAVGVLMESYDPEKAWFPSSWWNSAVALETVGDYMQRTGDRQYLDEMDRTFERNKGVFPAGELSGDPLLGNFTSRAIDDSEWWALTWLQAYDLTKDRKYLDMAVTIGNYVQGYWDTTCGGGVWWDAEKTYKNAVTTGLYVRLTAELHNRIAGDTVWLERSQAGWKWLMGSGMVNADGLVNDGLTGACANNGGTVWSYNQGLFIGAGLELWRATGDAQVLATSRRLADSAITSPALVTDGVLTEKCDAVDASCDDNAKQFKGIFMRYFMDLNDTVKEPRHQAFVDRQATSVWTAGRDGEGRLGQRWAGADSVAHPNVFDWRTQASALSALIAAVPKN